MIKVVGPSCLRGNITISGSKNASFPIICASILLNRPVVLHNLANIKDVEILLSLLADMKVVVTKLGDNSLSIDASKFTYRDLDLDKYKKIRAGILLISVLLARTGCVIIPRVEGGCNLNKLERRINWHLEVLQALGAELTVLDDPYHRYLLKSGGLQAAEYTFPGITVTGTENAIIAASTAVGTTILHNCAIEPEIMDLIQFFRQAGSNIHVQGRTITLIGSTFAAHTEEISYTIMPDRIEAGSYMLGALITKGAIHLSGKNLSEVVLDSKEVILQLGGKYTEYSKDHISVEYIAPLRAIDVATGPFPAFSTDLQAILTVACVFAQGTSTIKETLYDNRVSHALELIKMGADILIHDNTLQIKGGNLLHARILRPDNLRAAKALLLAALATQDTTYIADSFHLFRGYEDPLIKLASLSASVSLVENEWE